MSSLLSRLRHRDDGDVPAETFLVLGLGNPGAEYADTPHNAGFIAADYLAEQLGCRYWKSEGGAQVCVADITTERGQVRVVIAKPLDYMNRSGSAAKNLAQRYGNVPAERTIAIHDDLDLPRGDVRCKVGGGHGGHNGLRSIHEKLGTADYLRVRVGIGRPPGQMDPAKYVLAPWKKDQLEELRVSANTASDAARHIVEVGILSAMNRYNGVAGTGTAGA